MENDINNDDDLSEETRPTKKPRSSRTQDLKDSPHDEERMKPEEVILDLPDVEDIPGQEHIHVPSLDALGDTTISSDDEEGAGLFDDDDKDEDTELIMGTEADITSGELKDLEVSSEDMPTDDDTRLRESGLDEEDEEGELLNEGSLSTDVSGADLDVSGADSDDPNEAIGEEDEENNAYSLGGDSNDNVTEGTP